MKRSNPSRLLSLLLVLAMVLAMFPMTVFAAEDTATYAKVTEDQTDWSGKYLLVYESGSLAFDGSLSTVDAVNNYTSVTISDSTITASSSIAVTIEAVDGGYVMKSASGLYLYHSSDANKLSSTENQSTAAKYPLTISVTEEGTDIALSGGAHMRFNANADQMRFRYYKSSSYANQQPVALYKLTSSSSETPEDPSTPSEDPSEPEVTGKTYTLTDTLSDGDQVLLYNAGNSAALTSTASGYKLAGETLTPENDTIVTDLDTVVWTVGVSEDGTYTFSQGEKVLGMVQSGTYVNLSTSAADGCTAWTLESSSTDKVFYLKNIKMPEGSYGPYYLEYYSGGFTAYGSSSPSDPAFGISFYALSSGTTVDPSDPTTPSEPDEEEPEVTYATQLTSLPNNGDTIIIYNSGNAMGSAASGKKLSGVAAEVTEDGLPILDGMAQLLVTVDGENYIFTLDGKYLTSADTGNGLSFADELTDCGKWTLEAATNGTWYIKNVGANYNGSYNQAMEYYSGFTTYGIKDTEIYQMQLYLVSEAPVYAVPDGTYVIWAPAYNMSLSSDYAGTYYNQGVAVTETDGTLTGYGATEIWTVTNNTDGTVSISYGGQNLGMADSYSSLTLGAVNDDWTLEDAGNGLYYVKNTGRSCYIEWYAEKNNWSGYYKISSGSEGMFALKFTPATAPETDSTLPNSGDAVVIYNLSAQGVLAAENDTQSIENALTTIDEEGYAHPANGGVVFTVEQNGTYYRFYNETYGYLCSNGTGNNAFYTQEASEDADWTLTSGKSGGYNLESRTAKYNGTYSQYLEYYADSYKTYSMYNVTDYDIYEFCFYPVAEDVNVTNGIVNVPDVIFGNVQPAYLGMDYTYSFGIDAIFGVDTLTVTASAANETDYSVRFVLEPVPENGTYTVTVTADQLLELSSALENADLPQVFGINISGTDTTGVEFVNGSAIDIIDEPVITDVTPAANTETLDEKKPTISATIINAGEDAAITMTVNGEEVEAVYADGVLSYTPAEDMADGRTTVVVTVTRADGKTVSKTWSFTVGEAQYALYFGQLHSHTTYSDGSGSLESALDYIASLPESANVDFVAFTDHSNYFDGSSAGTTANPEGALYDMSLASEVSQNLWSSYKNAVAEFNASSTDVIAIAGFEMTWSGGPGHMNTFNTAGIVSRNNTTLNNKTSDAGMKAYYSLLSQNEGIDSISQFNHPGSTFGTFSDFAYWDAVIDSRIYLVEVGNGEGQIGAGGYYPSYEYYTMALDKGWHVAPTNNQDNHKGKWGNANDARDVILTDNFTEEGIYDAIKALRVYATEDKNLEITYSVNGNFLGSTIEEVPEELNIAVTVYDPDSSDSISKVEVIVNSGKVAYTWDDPTDLADGALECTISPDYSYYYIRVTEGDGDLAVTAPVWVGESLKLGISSVETSTSTPVTGEELTINTTLFNSESSDATITSLVYTIGDEVIGTDTTGYTMAASGTTTVPFAYTPDKAKVTTVTVTAYVTLDGVDYTFSMDIELDVQDASKLVYIGIDASHYNEYVNGNYKDSMGNFSELAAEYSVRTVTLYTSEELIAACSNEKYVALIMTAPSRRSSEAQAADPLKVYTDEELAAIKAFNQNGGTVILAGWSDHYENYPDVASIAGMSADEHMAATQNAVLEALGSSLRIGDDATYDDSYNGGQAYRLYFNTYNFDSFLVDGVEVDAENPHDRMYTEVFSHYGGASVYTVGGELTSTVTPIVYGHSTTYSVDVDNDGLGGDSMYKYTYADGDDRLMIMASEQIEGQGLIIVSGAAFMSNFEVQATIEDSGSEKNYSNYKVCENLLAYLNPVEVSSISEVRVQTETGVKYIIEGVVTSNASGYDKDTAFFDCIYVQDETGGICCFPVAGNYKIGDLVRITGTTDFYQGEPELQVTSIEVIGEGTVEATSVTASQVNDRSVEGMLITVTGTVESFEYANDLVQTILVKDASGDVVRVFIDGYITTSYDVEDLEVGCNITVTGLASYDDTFNAPEGPFPRIRVRDRHDVVCTEAHVHNYTVTESVEATCETDGYTVYTCSCGDSYTETIPATGHNVVLVESSPATCELNGYEYYACEHCGGQEYTIILEATGHSYVDGKCEHCGAEDPNASKPGSGSIFDKIKDWIGGWFSPSEPEEPTEPSVPETSEPSEPTEPVEPEQPSKPGWGDWFHWFWPFG